MFSRSLSANGDEIVQWDTHRMVKEDNQVPHEATLGPATGSFFVSDVTVNGGFAYLNTLLARESALYVRLPM